MKKRFLKNLGGIILFFCLFIFIVKTEAAEEGSLYRSALEEVKLKRPDFAFMFFNSILKSYPNSKYTPLALFAAAEYCFQKGDYYDAAMSLRRFISEYPRARAKLFALAYILEIAHMQNNQKAIDAFEKEIISFSKNSQFFKKRKIYKYKSPFSNIYKAIFFEDKIEIYFNNKLLVKISF